MAYITVRKALARGAVVVALLIVAGVIAFTVADWEPPSPGLSNELAAAVARAMGATLEPIEPATAKTLGLQPQSRGLIVTSLAANGPALAAGLHVGDVVERIDGVPTSSLGDVESALRHAAGPLHLTMNRGGTHAIVSLQPRPMPMRRNKEPDDDQEDPGRRG